MLLMKFYKQFILYINHYQNKMMNSLNTFKYIINSLRFFFYTLLTMNYIWIIFKLYYDLFIRVIICLFRILLLDLYIISLKVHLIYIISHSFNQFISVKYPCANYKSYIICQKKRFNANKIDNNIGNKSNTASFIQPKDDKIIIYNLWIR